MTAMGSGVSESDTRQNHTSDIRGMSGEEILRIIDKEMYALYRAYRFPENFYNQFHGVIGNIRYSWLAYDIQRHADKYQLPFLFSPILYDPIDKSGLSPTHPRDIKSPIGTRNVHFAGGGNRAVPVWGKDYYERWYTDWEDRTAYWFENGWSGYRLNGQFWNNSGSREVLSYAEALSILARTDKPRHDYYIKSLFIDRYEIPGFDRKLLNDLIQYGVDRIWGGIRGVDVDFRSGSPYSQRRNGLIHNRGESPPGKDWVDCILIMIPPTYIAWGYGVRFSEDPNIRGRIYTMDIPIAPINMLLDDFDARYIDPPARAIAGNRVTMTVSVSSRFTEEKTARYVWSIPGASGIEYHNGGATGNVTIPAMGSVEMRISFTMPEDGVHVRFEVNPNREIVENGDYENNVAEHFVAPQTPPAPSAINIPAWVLRQRVSFSMSSTATLSLPRGSWNGNATGSLGVVNHSENIYNDFADTNNPGVNEASTTITRRPNITAVLDRADFGDNPKEGHFAPSNSTVSESALVTASGSVSRPYTWTSGYYNSRGNWISTTHYGTAVSNFAPNPNNDRRTYVFDVYNGMKDLPPRRQPFRSRANLDRASIAGNSVKYELEWEGTPIPFDVVRWMSHRDANNVDRSWEAVGGQYERTFIGQSEGSLLWETRTSQAGGYRNDRDNARSGRTGQSFYTNAVFATNRELQSIEYPIKSGYYFNPLVVCNT